MFKFSFIALDTIKMDYLFARILFGLDMILRLLLWFWLSEFMLCAPTLDRGQARVPFL